MVLILLIKFYLRSWSDPSSDLSSLLFINGNFLLKEKFFFFLSNVDCYKQNVIVRKELWKYLSTVANT